MPPWRLKCQGSVVFMIEPSGASSFLYIGILRQVKTPNTTLIPDELALLLSSSFSFNQQFSHLGISCRVLLTVSFPTRLLSSSQCSLANFQMSSVTSCPSPAIWEPRRPSSDFPAPGICCCRRAYACKHLTMLAPFLSKPLLAFLPEFIWCLLRDWCPLCLCVFCSLCVPVYLRMPKYT